jgi:TolB-like protein/DNA-binding winged helix-turn-helix (wHTH) protein
MSSRFRIGELTLDTGRHQVLRDSKPVALGPLTYQLLRTLVEAAPNVVSHDELAASIWKGRLVTPETISQRVKLLRDALADDPHNPRYIELVRGRGYRLVPFVEVMPDEAPARSRIRWITTFVIAFALLAAAGVLFWVWNVPKPSAQESNSIAVLPFVDLSAAQDQQYLGDGIAEEILSLLSKATTLRVIARTSSFSFRGNDADITRIAESLGVTHILEGSVRQTGDRIRVTTRLIDASDGTRLWSESYDRSTGDILALQTDVARSIAAELKANLQATSDLPTSRVNPKAYDLYLRGQQKLQAQSLDEAASYFEQAIAIDPEFIAGYYGLGVAYVWQVVDVWVAVEENRERLRDILDRALALAPDDPGLIALSGQLARYDGKVALAEERFETALEKDPSNSVLRVLYPTFKLDQSHPEEALRLARRALEIDPLNPVVYIIVWASHMDLWDPKEAMAAAAHYRELAAPSDGTGDDMTGLTRLLLSGDIAGSIVDARRSHARRDSPFWRAFLYYFVGDLQTADALTRSARASRPDSPTLMALKAYGALAQGDVGTARTVSIAALTSPKKIWGGHDIDVGIIRLAVDAMIARGEAQEAIDVLEKLAPHYAHYKNTENIDAADFSPAPVPVKSAFSSFPALYFADYIRALRAAGDEVGANQMLDHLEAALDLRRRRGLFIEERLVAEALALRGKTEAALDALEKAERDRTIYHRWQLVLLHNEVFATLRDHPRFLALVERIQSDLAKQREQLRRDAAHW